MKRLSRVTFALIVALAVTGAGVAYFAVAKPRAAMAPTEAVRPDGELHTIVGDETPFIPEW